MSIIKEILFLESVFQEKIWGGKKLREVFGYNLESNKTGECWAISAHTNGDCVIKNTEYAGKTLSWLWKNHRDLFGDNQGSRFPLLTKIIDAKEDLSVQVHPSDDYAYANENGELGKTECWYILHCNPGAELVLGHNAKTKTQLKEMIDKGLWTDLLRKVSIKPGDFFYIPAGTIHAIGKGTMILETQQSSDLTYRVYDYDRLENGKPRQLHIDKTIDVTQTPHNDYQGETMEITVGNGTKKILIQSDYFTVYKVSLRGKGLLTNCDKFKLVSVTEGEGTLDGTAIVKGDHFIIPQGYGCFTLDGELEIIVSYC